MNWEYRVLDDHIAKNVQMLCSMQPVDGLDVNIYLDMAQEEAGAAPLPGSYQLGGAFGVYARLHLLGLNPANWTADPLCATVCGLPARADEDPITRLDL